MKLRKGTEMKPLARVHVVWLGEGRGPFSACLAQLLIHSGQTGIQLGVTNVRSSNLVSARTNAAMSALGVDPPLTHLLWLDDDMTVPSDALLCLLERNLPVVGCNYARKDLTGRPVASIGLDATDDSNLISSVGKTGVEKVIGLGFGCLLIRREVFTKIRFPWFGHKWWHAEALRTVMGVPEANQWRDNFEDAWFCQRCQEIGIDVWMDHDLSQRTGHYGGVVHWIDGSLSAM